LLSTGRARRCDSDRECEALLVSLPGIRRTLVAGIGQSDESRGVGALEVLEPVPGSMLRRSPLACREPLLGYKVPAVTALDELDFPLSALSALSASLTPDCLAARCLLSDV